MTRTVSFFVAEQTALELAGHGHRGTACFGEPKAILRDARAFSGKVGTGFPSENATNKS